MVNCRLSVRPFMKYPIGSSSCTILLFMIAVASISLTAKGVASLLPNTFGFESEICILSFLLPTDNALCTNL